MMANASPLEKVGEVSAYGWGTDVSGLTRSLATLPQKVDPGAFSGQKQGWKTPRGPSGSALLLCMYSGSALLGDLLGVSRSVECDLLSVRWIYPRIFLCVFIVYRRIVRLLCLLLYSAIY